MNSYEKSPLYLLVIGLLAALFFSATFVINRAISLEGGHWYWTASLRFFYTVLFLALGFIFFKGFDYFKKILKDYINRFWFYTISGIIGFGFFYSILFLYARSIATSSSKLVIVDASQSGEVFFALIAEMIFLSALAPSVTSLFGIFLTIFGLILLVKFGK
ncbi:hypothetical protein CP965_09345 [Halarcobacter mediterraneus]|uniref:EamA domain-containing protein n=1 Tax=Halarcobacter mediterraneus TaxID=2023153 RepID=A0A4Q1AVW1_9BACT|nr:multidrug resistance efflux transporter family protein [Halarcobacter mediterraneus]RXK12769.1 hypothetical protein CP965_09345 [Halarcobacter mediterraneus]